MSDPVAETPAVSAADIVTRYIALRDKKAEFKAEYDKKVEAVEKALERCEAYILNMLDEIGGESIKTAAGTAYVSTRTSATAADWDMVLGFIREGGHWGMLEKRVSKAFVEAYKAEHNDLPPGVNWRAERTVNIRRN